MLLCDVVCGQKTEDASFTFQSTYALFGHVLTGPTMFIWLSVWHSDRLLQDQMAQGLRLSCGVCMSGHTGADIH